MEGLKCVCLLLCAFVVAQVKAKKTVADMFPHKHKFPIPPMPFPIPGWDPDKNPWDEKLYAPLKPQLQRGQGPPPTVRLTSDSPAMNGSMITFTAAIEHAPCMKETANGELVYDEHCEDANGQQVRSGWMEDYGFGKCANPKRCNVFPDGKPFPQSNDWRRKGYVYVWHTMGQYYETCDGSSSHISLNTSGWTSGAGVMEVLVYRKREIRKYVPFATDNHVFFITDKIPISVDMSQKQAANLTERNVFVRGSDVVFSVNVHDPSSYLKTAAAVDYIWDFRDGNQLVTHSNVATHAYRALGSVSVKLTVEAAFRTACPPPGPQTPPPPPPPPPQPPTPTPMHITVPPTKAPTAPPIPAPTHAVTPQPTTVPPPPPPTTPAGPPTTTAYVTEPLPTDLLPTDTPAPPPAPGPGPTFGFPTMPPMVREENVVRNNECFRYMYGTFEQELNIIEPLPNMLAAEPPSRIVEISAAKVTNGTVNFLVTYLGSDPTSACTVVSDASCHEVKSIKCDDVPMVPLGCQVLLRRTFREPGTYCVNIILEDAKSRSLATTTVTIDKSTHNKVSKSSRAAEVVLSSSAVLVVIFAFIAFMVYKRYKVYQPVRRSLVEDAGEPARSGAGGGLERLRAALFPANEERSRLLVDPRPL
ncbi:protein QNR-71 isoform X2 [Engraulis encrasicolus]|uniref:protein QNR-71 isoform X2 n=1 Tax=Engraulis encrasicolus TaxID=184585 RepID=UPI002FD21FB6